MICSLARWLPLIFPAVVGVFLYAVLRPKSDPLTATIFTTCFMVFPCFYPVSWGFRRAILDKVRLPSPRDLAPAALLAAGRCAACGYPLSNLTVEGDKCVQCPECGAAWNRNRPPAALST